jgi:serine acetyltransferase
LAQIGEPNVTSRSNAFRKFTTAVRADRDSLTDFQGRYNQYRGDMDSFLSDVTRRIGFQMTVVIRIMQLMNDLGVPLGGAIVSRLIRHLYGAEIHWEAHIEPGITIVHGNGLVISHGASVGSGCLLFQGVTLGESMDPVTKVHGAPSLGRNVHVMPNAVLIGPITVGENSKIQANVTLTRSVPVGTSVRGANPEFVMRDAIAQTGGPDLASSEAAVVPIVDQKKEVSR